MKMNVLHAGTYTVFDCDESQHEIRDLDPNDVWAIRNPPYSVLSRFPSAVYTVQKGTIYLLSPRAANIWQSPPVFQRALLQILHRVNEQTLFSEHGSGTSHPLDPNAVWAVEKPSQTLSGMLIANAVGDMRVYDNTNYLLSRRAVSIWPSADMVQVFATTTDKLGKQFILLTGQQGPSPWSLFQYNRGENYRDSAMLCMRERTGINCKDYSFTLFAEHKSVQTIELIGVEVNVTSLIYHLEVPLDEILKLFFRIKPDEQNYAISEDGALLLLASLELAGQGDGLSPLTRYCITDIFPRSSIVAAADENYQTIMA